MQKFIPKNPAFRKAIEEVLGRQNFMNHLGFRLVKVEPGYVEGKAAFEDFLEQQNGFLHGGAIATFADLVTGFAAYSLVNENEMVMTVELKISYLNPGTGGTIYARGWVLKTGARLHFCEAEIYGKNNEGEEYAVAKASATMITLPKPA